MCLLCLNLACVARNQGDRELASPKSVELQQKVLLERGLSYSRSGEWERAEEYLSAALDAGASVDDALPPLLQSCIAGRRYRTAAEHAHDNLPRLRRKRLEVELVLAALYLSLEEPERALQLIDHVVKLEPSNGTAQYLLANTLRERFQEFEKADLHYRKYLELEPEGRYAELARGNLLGYVVPEVQAVTQGPRSAAPLRQSPSSTALTPESSVTPEPSSP